MTEIAMIVAVSGGLVLSVVLSIRKWKALQKRDE